MVSATRKEAEDSQRRINVRALKDEKSRFLPKVERPFGRFREIAQRLRKR